MLNTKTLAIQANSGTTINTT